VNIFVAFGGTSFGATAGANGFNPLYDYIPHVTSYDEDSPVTEHGRATPKYFKLREAFQRYYGSAVVLPAVPEPPQPMAVISGISIEQRGSLFSNRPPPTLTGSPLTYF
jgi:beta-galactosidase